MRKEYCDKCGQEIKFKAPRVDVTVYVGKEGPDGEQDGDSEQYSQDILCEACARNFMLNVDLSDDTRAEK